jgi:hypothetical protein
MFQEGNVSHLRFRMQQSNHLNATSKLNPWTKMILIQASIHWSSLQLPRQPLNRLSLQCKSFWDDFGVTLA